MSSSGRAEDTYRVGTKDAGPICKFTGISCACGTDCRCCNVPQNSISARILEAICANKLQVFAGIMDSAELQACEPELNVEELEHELQREGGI